MMARRRKGLRSLGSGFGESQLLKGFPPKKNHSRRRVGLPRCQGANCSHRITKAQLGKNLLPAPRGDRTSLALARGPSGLGDSALLAAARESSA